MAVVGGPGSLAAHSRPAMLDSTNYHVRDYRIRITRFTVCGLPCVHEYTVEHVRRPRAEKRHRWYVDDADGNGPLLKQHIGIRPCTHPTLGSLLADVDRAMA